VVAYAFQIAGDDQSVERLRRKFGLLLDERAERIKRCIIHLVDLIVESQNRFGQFGVAFDEGLEGFANHCGRERGQLWNVDGKIDVGEGSHLSNAHGDVDRLVAYALQIGVDPDHGEDEAKVDGHWLFHGQEVERHLIDLTFEAVDGGLSPKDKLADGKIARAISFDGTLNCLFGHARHHEQLFFQVVEALMKFDPHQPNLPVM
jgi:hypothetical protein